MVFVLLSNYIFFQSYYRINNNHYKVINSKDYGSVQSRERIYIVSIRKDIDNGLFSFIDKIDNKKVMKDIVENLNGNDYYILFFLSQIKSFQILF
jgi:hypothetical protein